jgi:hypothetical protein
VVRGTLKISDLLDGALARVAELLGERDLFWIELGASAALATSRASGGEPVAGVGDDQLALPFGENAEHAEHRATSAVAGVDALLDDMQADAASAELGAEGHEVQDRSAEAIQPGFASAPSRATTRNAGGSPARIAFERRLENRVDDNSPGVPRQ